MFCSRGMIMDGLEFALIHFYFADRFQLVGYKWIILFRLLFCKNFKRRICVVVFW